MDTAGHHETSERLLVKDDNNIESNAISMETGKKDSQTTHISVSIITPVHNGEQWLDEYFQSVCDQIFAGSLELSVYNDASTDSTDRILRKWEVGLTDRGIKVSISCPQSKDTEP